MVNGVTVNLNLARVVRDAAWTAAFTVLILADVAGSSLVWAQSPPVSFEAASVKPHPSLASY
jgi:hypothetical protein